jgi:hypothetical protein
MCNAIHQNRLALDYLLASEGGVCGKFNLSNSCLQIDDEGKAIEEITDRMRKLTQVPVQTWRGWDPNDLFECWLFCLRWIQNPDRGNGPDPRSVPILPCLVPLVLWSIRMVLEAVIERKWPHR